MKRIVAFQGADAKVGTTMIAQSVAEAIAGGGKTVRVFFAACNGRSGTEYFDSVGEWIENLRMSLENRVLSPVELMENCRRSENLYVLGGVGGILQDRRYRPEMISYLLELLEERIDLFIADCGSEMDHALAVGAMERADDRYCVLTQQESSLRRYEKLSKLYERMELPVSAFVLNKYEEEDPCSALYVEKRISAAPRVLYSVSAVPQAGRAEAEHRTLLSYGKGGYAEEIRLLANQILKDAGLPLLEKQRKGLWRNSI